MYERNKRKEYWVENDKIGGEGKYLPWLRCFLLLFPLATATFFLMPNVESGAYIIAEHLLGCKEAEIRIVIGK